MNYNEYRNRCFRSISTRQCGTSNSLGTCGYVSKPCYHSCGGYVMPTNMGGCGIGNYSCGGGGCRYCATCGGYGGGGGC